jgi:hypothetical protein
VGEAARRRRFWPAASTDSPAPARTHVDLIYPGQEKQLLQQVGGRAERCRRALGRALYDLCVGAGTCAYCDHKLDSLNALACVIVSHIEVRGRITPSPSWSLCTDCCDTVSNPVILAEKLARKYFASLSTRQQVHPAEKAPTQ